MFRLEDRQLHILIGLLGIASVFLFFIFCGSGLKKQEYLGTLKGMNDFSEAWVCNYELKNTENHDLKNQNQEKKNMTNSVTEVINFPAEFSVEKGGFVILTHKVPEFDMETLYLTFETQHQSVQVYIDQDLIYKSKEINKKIPSVHRIPLSREYEDKVIKIELIEESNQTMKIGALQVGTYNELLAQAILENGLLFVVGGLLIITSLSMLFVYVFIKNEERKKRLLLYSALEGLLFGCLFFIKSHLIQVLLDWNYAIHFIGVCLLITCAILHLMIMRCFVYKKKVLFLLDIGILCYGVLYISAMVLQGFSLVQFDTIYRIVKIIFLLSIIFYTVSLAVAIYDYGQKQGKIVLFANVVCILFILAQGILFLTGRQKDLNDLYILLGFSCYFILTWVYAVKQASQVQIIKQEVSNNRKEIQEDMMKQLNPNLLFLSFRTLQNLIKNDSSNSIKMIYYISVYLRDNLKAFEQSNQIIKFEEEMEHILSYLQLQKIRNPKLVFSMECKEKDFRIPRNSIEPLVENAVKHGIEKKKDGGNVVVRTYRRKEGYAIQVIDDGVGFDSLKLKKKSSTSVLRIFDKLEGICDAQTEIISKEGKGTVITLVLPMLENDLIEG